MNLKDAGIYDLVNLFQGKPTDAHSASQGGIIGNKSRLINIPAYQRPYRWTSDNINRLFLDYDDNNSEYFLGSAVVVEKKKADDSIEFDMVDGQQRITTLYLMNYIRFLLKREYVLEKISKRMHMKSSEYCNELKNYYVNLIGKKAEPFDTILAKIDELNDNDDLDADEKVKQLVDCYKSQLCIPDNKSNPHDTLKEKRIKAHNFFDDEQLCLKYSRKRYDTILRDALCIVYLKKVENTNNYELDVTDDKYEPFAENYLNAMKTIFANVWERAQRMLDPNKASSLELCEKAVLFLDEIIRNMSFCIVLTKDEKDANKLFEVLNDRALEVEDLELIKNYFYKEYCTKSGDVDDVIDENITKLDEIWADNIFSDNTPSRQRMISYFATIYLTSDTELVYKDNTKFKDSIERNYSSRLKKYTYDDILSDFNVYYAIKIIFEKFDIKLQKTNEKALEAELENKSVTYKTIHFLNALKYTAVLPALINVIISTYVNQNENALIAIDFKDSFSKFIQKIIDDKNNSHDELFNIHKCAYTLWVAAVKSKDFSHPRNIARRIISKYGRSKNTNDNIDFEGDEIAILNESFDQWLNTWTYNSARDIVIKVLLLKLLRSERKTMPGDETNVVLTLSALTYNLDANRLQLDHLEAKEIDITAPEQYYLHDDKEKRQKDVNEYLGNFMILDKLDNNMKNNVPMKKALGYYDGISKSWLIEDIKTMIGDARYFDLEKDVPQEEFFKQRSKNLKKYFKALLNKTLQSNTFSVELS